MRSSTGASHKVKSWIIENKLETNMSISQLRVEPHEVIRLPENLER